MKYNKIILFIMVMSIVFVGCASTYNRSGNDEGAERIVKGMTYSEVISILGEPDKKGTYHDGIEYWHYYPSFFSLHGNKVVRFENGIVVDFETQYK